MFFFSLNVKVKSLILHLLDTEIQMSCNETEILDDVTEVGVTWPAESVFPTVGSTIISAFSSVFMQTSV